jgi:GDP-4-dehydro-6-deoxy-D-mannose reductase
MKALVTGASGFVGPVLVAHLSECGDDVVAPGDHESGFDITDRAAVHETLAEHRPDVVYHLAAFSHVGASWDDPTTCLRVNVEGTAHVLDAARAAGVQRVLVVGSAEEYGRVDATRGRITEDTEARPITPYGASKVAASVFALQAWLGADLETIRTRTFSHTGPTQPDRFVVPALAHRIAEAERAGRDSVAVGNIDPVRDLSDVRDVVRAYRLLVEHGRPGEVYNVCRGQGVSIGEIGDALVDEAHGSMRLVVDDSLVRPVDVPWLVGDNAKLHDATGWEPEVALTDTLAAVLAAARARYGS